MSIRRAMKIALFSIVGLIVLGFATIGVLYVTRGTPVQHVRSVGASSALPQVGEPRFTRVMELLTQVEVQPGNRAEVFINGDQTYPRLMADLRAAQRSITMQMYYCQPGRMADEMQAMLIERARAGVKVYFLADAFGAQNLPEEWFDAMKAAGVEVAQFRPVHWYSLDKASHRSHIRVVVVDGSVGYTGGFGLDDKWYGDGRHKDQWRDSNVRFEGPSVMQHQATFIAAWAEATGDLLTGELLLPPDGFQHDGPMVAGTQHLSPTTGSTPAERFLALTIAAARERLYISNSYFVPDDDFRRMLTDAAKRGVDVRILTTSDETDVKTTWHAGRRRYEELLTAGVKIYEYQPTMMHAKTIVVDGMWSSIGTMNFDNRSLVFNDETNFVALDADLGRRMEEIFLEDLRFSKEIVLEEFRRRPLMDKMLELGATLFQRVL